MTVNEWRKSQKLDDILKGYGIVTGVTRDLIIHKVSQSDYLKRARRTKDSDEVYRYLKKNTLESWSASDISHMFVVLCDSNTVQLIKSKRARALFRQVAFMMLANSSPNYKREDAYNSIMVLHGIGFHRLSQETLVLVAVCLNSLVEVDYE